MKYELYAVEVFTNSNPLTYELAVRIDEKGPGSPLVWPDRAGAEAFIAEIAEQCGEEPDAQAVLLSGETDSENESPWNPLFGEMH